MVPAALSTRLDYVSRVIVLLLAQSLEFVRRCHATAVLGQVWPEHIRNEHNIVGHADRAQHARLVTEVTRRAQ